MSAPPLLEQDRPLVLVRTVAERQVIVGACAAARSAGVRGGFTLAQARALCPGVIHADHNPGRDATALEALARWMMRFTPVVQCDSTPYATAILLDVTGTQRLFGNLENLMDQLADALMQLRIGARLAIAPTPGAAWALTYGDPSRRPIVTGDILPALEGLPPVALRLAPQILDTLHHLGLTTIGQIARLPRDLLPARFGPDLLMRIDQALGHLAEPLTPLPYHAPIEASIEFDGVVDSLEAIWISFQDLIAKITRELTRRGLGARRISITFKRPYAPAIEKTIDLSSPSRNETIIFNLIRCAMETIGKAKATKRRSDVATKGRGKGHVFALRRSVASSLRRYEHFTPAGFTGLRLSVVVSERLEEEQIFLSQQEELTSQNELNRLIERLQIRLGEGAMTALKPVESHLPEQAYKPSPPNTQDSALSTQHYLPRPLHLLPIPKEIPVMVRPSDDLDGAPISFTLAGQLKQIIHAVGPERISGPWWRGRDKTRDYFDAEDQSGRRWWMFRVSQTSRWFLHGEFE